MFVSLECGGGAPKLQTLSARPVYKRCAVPSAAHSPSNSRSTSTTSYMMTSKLFLVLACVALVGARLVRRETTDPAPLQDIQKHASEDTQNLAKEVAKNVEETNEKMVSKIEDAHDDLVPQAQAMQQQDTQILAKEIAKNVEEMNQKMVSKIEDAHDDLVQAPAMQQQVKDAAKQ